MSRSVYIAEPLPGDQAGGSDCPLTSKREALRWLASSLGITGAQAHKLFAAYARDLEDERRIGNDTGRGDADFIAWLMRQRPGGKKPAAIPKHAWRLSS